MLGRGLIATMTRPTKGIRLARDVLGNLPAVARSVGVDTSRVERLLGLDRDDAMLSQAMTRPPRTGFNAVIGPHRAFSYTSVPLDGVKSVKRAFDVTINDVVMAMCAAALRQYLIDHDDLPDDPLIAMVPVSVRTESQQGAFGNRIASMTASLHTDVEDPVERLVQIHQAMLIAKETHRALPATLQQDFAQFAPPAVAARAARVIARASARRWVDLPYNVVISNVPGPQFRLYGVGARLVANYPVSTIHDGVGLNMTVQSYDGNLDFGVVGCRDLVPDIWDLVDHLHHAIDELGERAVKG